MLTNTKRRNLDDDSLVDPAVAEVLWLRNGPEFPFDLCFDFQNKRVLMLTAVAPGIGRRGMLGSLFGRGRRSQKERYQLLEDLPLEERLKADKERVVIPFDNVIRVALAKPWGRPPVLLLESNSTEEGGPVSKGTNYVRRQEFALASDRHLREEQVSQIRVALPPSGLGQKFKDMIR